MRRPKRLRRPSLREGLATRAMTCFTPEQPARDLRYHQIDVVILCVTAIRRRNSQMPALRAVTAVDGHARQWPCRKNGGSSSLSKVSDWRRLRPARKHRARSPSIDKIQPRPTHAAYDQDDIIACLPWSCRDGARRPAPRGIPALRQKWRRSALIIPVSPAAKLMLVNLCFVSCRACAIGISV